jgi:MFS family permease
VWGWSVLHAGVALFPGPVFAAVTAVIAGRVAVRVGQYRLAFVGCLLFAAAQAAVALRIHVDPNYWSVFLPSSLAGGTGVGLTLAPLSSAAAASLPPQRFATGSAVFTMSRQLGSVVGVSILVALIGTPSPADALHVFHEGWWFIAGTVALAGLVAVTIGPIDHGAPASAELEAEAEAMAAV